MNWIEMMFWRKKKDEKAKQVNRDALIEQAKTAIQSKREEIGDETLTAIREAIYKKQNDPLAKAKKEIMATDLDKVLDHLTATMREDYRK